MQIINSAKLNYELKPQTLDDLWVLSQFIVPNDRVFSTTTRKVKIGNDSSSKQVKKVIFVDLDVKRVSFENDQLKVSGEILNETEFTAIGQAHTLNFEVNDSIKIEKMNLLKFEKKLLDNACNSKKSINFLVLMEKDKMVACEFSDFSYKVLFSKSGLGSKKYTSEEVNENEEKFKLIEMYLKKDYSNFIIAGPGFYKEGFSKYLKDKGVKNQVFSYDDVRSNSILKAIKSINKSNLLGSTQLSLEEENVSELLKNIDKGQKYVYGYDQTLDKINLGSCSKLIVTTKLIEDKKDSGEYADLNEVLRLVEDLKGELIIIDSSHEPGKIVDSFGGIAGILRY